MRKINIALLSILSVLVFSNFHCEEEMPYESGQVTYLSYGNSFGECLGYCKREIRIGGGISFTKSGWDENGALPDSSCSIVFVMDPLPAYLDVIDIDTFLAMDDTIGCPDCADGGAEWLELGFENGVKRVTFEYMNEPDAFSDIMPGLRDSMAQFNDCREDG